MVDEVLVHVLAPTTRHNDDLCMAVATAYLEFVPCDILKRECRDKPRVAPIVGLCELGDKPTASTNNAFRTSQTAPLLIPTTGDGSYGSILLYVPTEEQGGNEIGTQHRANNSEIPTSSRLARLERMHQQWRGSQVGTPLLSMKRDRQDSTIILDDHDMTTFMNDTQLAIYNLHSQLEVEPSPMVETTSCDAELLASCTGTNERLSDLNGALVLDIQESLISSSINLDSVSKSCGLSVHNACRLLSEPADPLEKEAPDLIEFTSLPLEVFASAPETSVDSPGTLPSQITKQLAALKYQNPQRFRPSIYTRTLESDERGYWLIDCSSWRAKLQHEFWCSLSNHIRSGRLGYGLTMFRENATLDSLGVVKLFCWGEIVEHTWLLLWLCCSGVIMESGASWIDADGVEVVRMSECHNAHGNINIL